MDKCLSPRSRLVNRAIGAASLVVLISVPLTHWPLRLAYHISRPKFETIAQVLRSGKTFPKPMQVGPFTIEKAEIDNGKVCLWTDLDPAGRTGFAKCSPKDVPFNLWSITELDENWQYISED